MNYNAYSEEMVLDGVKKFGPAPGARKMLDWEFNHAKEAIESGYYVTYYNESKHSECSRVGSGSLCFCGHFYKDHKQDAFKKKRDTGCLNCLCKSFAFIPQRPEEIGEWWLPRRKEFNIHNWRAKCKCKHGHDQHKVTRPFICTACGNCFDFRSDFECITCDCLWELHETLYETRDERMMLKKPVDDAYLPLNSNKEIQNLVFFEKPKNIANMSRPAQKISKNPQSLPKKALPVEPFENFNEMPVKGSKLAIGYQAKPQFQANKPANQYEQYQQNQGKYENFDDIPVGGGGMNQPQNFDDIPVKGFKQSNPYEAYQNFEEKPVFKGSKFNESEEKMFGVQGKSLGGFTGNKLVSSNVKQNPGISRPMNTNTSNTNNKLNFNNKNIRK